MYASRAAVFSPSSAPRYGQECKLMQAFSARPSSPAAYSFENQPSFEFKEKVEVESSLPDSTDVDSDEDSVESHFDAIEELSEIFEAAPIKKSSSVQASYAPFQRPCNPVVYDRQFVLPRCSAPAPRFYANPSAERSVKLESSFYPRSF